MYVALHSSLINLHSSCFDYSNILFSFFCNSSLCALDFKNKEHDQLNQHFASKIKVSVICKIVDRKLLKMIYIILQEAVIRWSFIERMLLKISQISQENPIDAVFLCYLLRIYEIIFHKEKTK